jgi:hypothetical protein
MTLPRSPSAHHWRFNTDLAEKYPHFGAMHVRAWVMLEALSLTGTLAWLCEKHAAGRQK